MIKIIPLLSCQMFFVYKAVDCDIYFISLTVAKPSPKIITFNNAPNVCQYEFVEHYQGYWKVNACFMASVTFYDCGQTVIET